MKKKSLLLVLALVLAVTAAVGGTLAWLTDSTTEVTNVFTTAGIDVELTETWNAKSTPNSTANDCWKAQLIPGYSYTKDPKVTVKANSVDCYLFVKFEENNVSVTKGNTTVKCLDYTSNLSVTGSGWTQGTGTDTGGNGVPTNVWYRKVTSSTADQSWELLQNNSVKVNENLTKDFMPAANAAPELVYTAYASQLYKSAGAEFTAAEAWANAQPTTPTT